MALSNQNNRTTAILKVVGLYLITFILLAFLFYADRGTEPVTEDIYKELEEIKSENKKMKEWLVYADTLSLLSYSFIKLNQKSEKNVAENKQFREIESDLSYYSQKLNERDGKLSENMRETREGFKNIGAALESIRNYTESFKDNVDNLTRKKDKELENSLDTKDEKFKTEQEKLEKEKEGLEKEIEKLEKEIEKCKGSLGDKQNEISQSGSNSIELESKLKEISKRLQKIAEDTKIALKKSSVTKSNKTELDAIYKDIGLLKNYIDK